MKKSLVAAVLLIAIAAWGLSIAPGPIQAQSKKTVPIGMAKTFFTDLTPALISIVQAPFADLMKAATGIDGELHTDRDAFTLADQLDKGAIQIGVFHGHELAWVRKKHSNIKALLVAVNKYRDVSSYILVHKDCSAQKLGDLRGKKIDYPLGTKQQCRVFLERHCMDNNQSDWTKFFSVASRSTSIVAAIDDVARKQCDAVVVDHIALEMFKAERGPVFDKQLRILTKSEPFPPVVICYKEGGIDSDVLKKFDNGLRKARELAGGAGIMDLWQVEAFESAPVGFEKMLADICQRYPAK